METQKQIFLVKQIRRVKDTVFASTGREEIAKLLKQLYETASMVPPAYSSYWHNTRQKNSTKDHALKFLRWDIEGVESDSYTDFDSIRFHVGTSRFLLMFAYIDGHEDRLRQILKEPE